MKHSISFLIFGCALAIAGCGAQTLDGGSNENKSGASGSETPAPGGGETTTGGAAIKETPAAGTIAGRPFEPKSIDVYFSKKDEQWFFSMKNYEADCGKLKTPPDPTTSLLVTIGGLDPKAGEHPLAYGDQHAGTFQIGIYDTTSKAETKSIEDGVLRFDAWDETPGAKLAGAIKATSGDSIIEGTFVAKMCGPR